MDGQVEMDETSGGHDNVSSASESNVNHTTSSPVHVRSKKHVHFGRGRRKVSVGPDLGRHSTGGSPGGIASDILEWLRPRALSDQISKHRRKSVDSNLLAVGRTCASSSRSSTATNSNSNSKDNICRSSENVNRPLFVDAKLATSWVNNIPQECLYQRATLSADHVMDTNRPFSRPRSNSELGRYLLVRRSRELNGRNDVVGRFEFADDRREQAYCQLLSTMKCYDVMPQFSKLVVLQSTLPIRKAFLALVNNTVRAAVVINPQTCTIVGMLTVTDLINALLEMSTKKSNASLLNLPLNKWSFAEKNNKKSKPHLLYINDSLYKATKLLCQRSVHRLIVLDSDTNGNPLFLLSKKMILQALQKYICLLPLPTCMHLRLNNLKIGTWNNITVVNMKTTVHKAMLKFLGKNVSCLPVVDCKNCVMDILTKVDLMNLVTASGTGESILQKTIEETIGERKTGAECMVTCLSSSTMLAAVENLLRKNAHRLVVVDADNHLEGIVSVADLMRFLIGNV